MDGAGEGRAGKGRPIRVLICDDHAVVRGGLRALLATETDMEVAGEAADGSEAVDSAERLAPDVIVMDLVMPGVDGVEATRRILERDPAKRVLVLTSFGSDEKLFPAVRAGALGFMLKDAAPDDLVRAIRQVAAGRSSLNPTIARRLLREMSHDEAARGRSEDLTPREVEVLREIAHGLSNGQIGQKLFISEATVRTHVSSILSKLGLESRTQAALYALKRDIASLE